MKTRNRFLTAFLIFITATGFAVEKPKMNIVSNSPDKAFVSFELDTVCPIQITIMNDAGEFLYSWTSKTPQLKFNKVFDFSNVGCGKYKVYFDCGEQSLTRDLNVMQKQIGIGPEVQLHKPFFRYSDGKLNLSFLNVALKSVYINIYKNGEYVTGLNLGKELDVQKRFDFSKLDKGEYEVVLSDFFSEHYYMVRK